MRKNKHIFYIQASDRPDTVGPDRPSARHDPLKGYRAVPGLRLRPSGLVRHAPFHFYCMPGLISKGTSPIRVGPAQPDMTHWPGITATCRIHQIWMRLSCSHDVPLSLLLATWLHLIGDSKTMCHNGVTMLPFRLSLEAAVVPHHSLYCSAALPQKYHQGT
jgi:hypothetical protein